jgi:hypothetical protein
MTKQLLFLRAQNNPASGTGTNFAIGSLGLGESASLFDWCRAILAGDEPRRECIKYLR